MEERRIQISIKKKERMIQMGVSASCVFLWVVYLFFGLFPLIYVTLKDKKGDKK